VRKTVTVVFCDTAGSTQFADRSDPERVRALMGRYRDLARRVPQPHGASVEKFIGDAVMAVFGVPVLHEADPLRALRAVCELRDELARAGIPARIGATTYRLTREAVHAQPLDGRELQVVEVFYEPQELQSLLGDEGWTARFDATRWFILGEACRRDQPSPLLP
jgi:class 3 adenylate cyclase